MTSAPNRLPAQIETFRVIDERCHRMDYDPDEWDGFVIIAEVLMSLRPGFIRQWFRVAAPVEIMPVEDCEEFCGVESSSLWLIQQTDPDGGWREPWDAESIHSRLDPELAKALLYRCEQIAMRWRDEDVREARILEADLLADDADREASEKADAHWVIHG